MKAPWLPNYDAFLLANHGATTLGRTLAEAHQRMESLEHGANILLTARLLGRVNALRAEDVRVLDAARFAPSSSNTQPWVFVVVRDAERRARLTDLMDRLWSSVPESDLAPSLRADVAGGQLPSVSRRAVDGARRHR